MGGHGGCRGLPVARIVVQHPVDDGTLTVLEHVDLVAVAGVLDVPKPTGRPCRTRSRIGMRGIRIASACKRSEVNGFPSRYISTHDDPREDSKCCFWLVRRDQVARIVYA